VTAHPVDFIAIDVETANACMASICQVGLAAYHQGQPVGELKSYVNPEDYFDGVNVSIHGITAETVRGAPTLPRVIDVLRPLVTGAVLVCHTHFDRVAIRQGLERYSLPLLDCEWLDTARVARRQWEEFSHAGYGLQNVCSSLGHEYQAHDALEDAKAAAVVLHKAMEESGLGVSAWLQRAGQPLGNVLGNVVPVGRSGNPDGPLYGETVVFTGALNISRREAAEIAAQLGCDVAESVTKKTTILVLGDQDARKLNGHDISSKHRKALNLIEQGTKIRIIDESGFTAMVA
jgi:DNA polymerase-3 subunit epsilon